MEEANIVTISQFVESVRRIADSRPVYRTGGTGADGTCDCIGLVMGALKKEYPLHSTNYFARFQTRNLQPIAGADALRIGDLLYKARADQGGLNERYLTGGRYDTGDRMDYYHAGVVLETDPLLIVHCTQTDDANGIAFDRKADGWDYAGQPADVEPEQPETQGWEAVVRAGSGSSVNLRSGPSITAARLSRIPLDTAVRVLKENGEWAQIRTPDGRTGYMMKRYLNRALPELEKRVAALESRLAALEAR